MSQSQFDRTINDFEDAIEYVTSMIGADFEKSLSIANDIIENPENYSAAKATITARKLAAQRYKIGVAAQYWKNKTVGADNRQDKLIKDVLMTAYDGLVEIINALKLTARQDHDLAGPR